MNSTPVTVTVTATGAQLPNGGGGITVVNDNPIPVIIGATQELSDNLVTLQQGSSISLPGGSTWYARAASNTTILVLEGSQNYFSSNVTIDSSGTIDVDVTNSSLTITGTVEVGSLPDVTIANATLNVGGTVDIGTIPDVTIASGTIDVGTLPDVTLASGTVVNVGSGTIDIGTLPDVTIANATLTVGGTVDIGTIPDVTIASGTIDVGTLPDVTLASGTVVNVGSGTIDIGNTPAVTVESGTIDIGNTPAVTIDTSGGSVPVTASGTVTVASITDPVSVGGTLDVQGVSGGTAIGVAGTVSVESGTIDIGNTPAVTVESGSIDIASGTVDATIQNATLDVTGSTIDVQNASGSTLSTIVPGKSIGSGTFTSALSFSATVTCGFARSVILNAGDLDVDVSALLTAIGVQSDIYYANEVPIGSDRAGIGWVIPIIAGADTEIKIAVTFSNSSTGTWVAYADAYGDRLDRFNSQGTPSSVLQSGGGSIAALDNITASGSGTIIDAPGVGYSIRLQRVGINGSTGSSTGAMYVADNLGLVTQINTPPTDNSSTWQDLNGLLCNENSSVVYFNATGETMNMTIRYDVISTPAISPLSG